MADQTQPASSTFSSFVNSRSTALAEITGYAALTDPSPDPTKNSTQGSNRDSATNAGDLASSSPQGSTSSDAAEDEEKPMAREDLTEEHENGPSSADRAQKSQKEIGTETGIPTSAGAGTTLCADDDVAPAARKEAELRKKKGHPTKAEVGVDYSDQPCPTSDARRDHPSSRPAEGKTRFDSREEQLHGSEAASKQSGSTASSNSTNPTSVEDDDEGQGEESQKVGWKQKVKGEAKILSGKITRNGDKVDLGKEIKAGGGQA